MITFVKNSIKMNNKKAANLALNKIIILIIVLVVVISIITFIYFYLYPYIQQILGISPEYKPDSDFENLFNNKLNYVVFLFDDGVRTTGDISYYYDKDIGWEYNLGKEWNSVKTLDVFLDSKENLKNKNFIISLQDKNQREGIYLFIERVLENMESKPNFLGMKTNAKLYVYVNFKLWDYDETMLLFEKEKFVDTIVTSANQEKN
jgi:hypothetical protein